MLLETKAHGHEVKRTWFGSDFVPTTHDSIVTSMWFLLQMSMIPQPFLTQTVRY
jgi:hypothetical protein